MNGELIGINEAKTASSSTGTSVDNIGFAIPIDKAETSLKQLMNLTTREKVDESQASYLGIEGQDVSEEATELYGIPSGVVVAEGAVFFFICIKFPVNALYRSHIPN